MGVDTALASPSRALGNALAWPLDGLHFSVWTVRLIYHSVT